MSFQRGSLKRLINKKGADRWVLRYRTTVADGRRVENTLNIGLVRDFPRERDAWREAERLTLLVKINETQPSLRLTFAELAELYLTLDFGEDAVRPKTEKTVANVRHLVRDYLKVRWGSEIAEEIRPIEIQRYFKQLNADGLAWPTISKIRGVMSRIYKVGTLHEHVGRNPVLATQSRSKTNYRAIVLSPTQTLAILQALPNILHRSLVITCAATALRASEALALRWADIRWEENRIRVSKRWSMGKDGATKNEASDGYVPLHPVLAAHLREWHQQTLFGGHTDFVFPSVKCDGRVPVSPSMFVAGHLRKAAIGIGISIEKGQRFGLHNFRHSLSHWLINKAKTEPKTVQGLLRHSRIQTTFDLYTQEDADETCTAQGKFLEALAMPTQTIQ